MKTKSFSVSGLSAKAVVYLSAIAVFTACSVKKNAVTTTQEQTQATGSRTSMQALLSFGSILQTLDFSADSVTIRMEHPRNDYCEDRGRTAAAPNSQREFPCSKPIHRGPCKQREVGCYSTTITAHQPRVKAEEQSHNLVVAQQQEQDTVSIQNQANSHADVSADTVGVATPMNGTAVVVIIILAVCIVATIFLLLFLKKWHIL